MSKKYLSLETITSLQKEYGITDLQEKIDSGLAWKLEGSFGRAAMSALEDGSCMLPEEQHKDYYGTIVPSRNDLLNGTKGTLLNSQNFWTKVLDGEIELN